MYKLISVLAAFGARLLPKGGIIKSMGRMAKYTPIVGARLTRFASSKSKVLVKLAAPAKASLAKMAQNYYVKRALEVLVTMGVSMGLSKAISMFFSNNDDKNKNVTTDQAIGIANLVTSNPNRKVANFDPTSPSARSAMETSRFKALCAEPILELVFNPIAIVTDDVPPDAQVLSGLDERALSFLAMRLVSAAKNIADLSKHPTVMQLMIVQAMLSDDGDCAPTKGALNIIGDDDVENVDAEAAAASLLAYYHDKHDTLKQLSKADLFSEATFFFSDNPDKVNMNSEGVLDKLLASRVTSLVTDVESELYSTWLSDADQKDDEAVVSLFVAKDRSAADYYNGLVMGLSTGNSSMIDAALRL